ncbi:hypothetical protein KEM56_000010 [Ascosphaera pollenicola]|nr:hypothetical protein KEM56_000010 [Ascosphaera pollenicola]
MSAFVGSSANTAKVSDSRSLLSGSKRPANTKPSGLVSLDNVLQNTSDIPSMHSRYPQETDSRSRRQERSSSRLKKFNNPSSRMRAVTSSGASRLHARPRLPPRTTKITEKLVLLPETVPEEESEDESDIEDEEEQRRLAPMDEDRQRERGITRRQRTRGGDFDEDNESAPLLAEEEALRKRRISAEKAKSYAERLPKARRAEKLPRVTAYCTAQAYKLSATAEFVKEYHGARTKLYDDCMYAAYHLPLLPGINGYRLRSSPPVKTVGGKAVLDEEIERNERRDYHEEFLDEAHEDEHSVAGSYEPDYRKDKSPNDVRRQEEQEHRQSRRAESARRAHIPPNALHFAESFVFSYGVVVFWNFTAHQEKDVLADLAFYSSNCLHHPETSRRRLPISLITNALPEEDFETEEFHFEYSTEISRPRVYNDMITLRSGDHMIKLAISHGIAQSTKLSFFEEVMAKQMDEAKDVPKRLALTGKLGMKREEMYRILGRLFKSRVEVNLSSNVLDVPNFFWDSEPTLHPLYTALREYLEIKPRIQVLNERCRVFLDLTEMLSDSMASGEVSRQTWIVIVLIVISIIVTVSEVVLRFGILSRTTPVKGVSVSE